MKRKAKDPLENTNYSLVSVLPLSSKIYQRLTFDQLSRHANKILSKLLCGFRKAHSRQHVFFTILKSWQKALKNSGYVGTMLMNLSKAYDYIPHSLLNSKLESCGLDRSISHLL